MKKVLLLATLLGGISFASEAAIGKSKVITSHKTTKPHLLYCQGVQFTCAYVTVCGETWQDYMDCLNEAKALFD